jgi:microcystin-dependent protein
MSERRTVYKDASTGVGGLGPSQSQTYVDGTKLMGQQYGHAAKEIADLVTTDPIIPIGVVNPFAGGTAPSGWLLCNGAEVSQVTYPTLYALISDTWGSAASGKFKLPDLRGRVITGADGGAGRLTSDNTLGDDGGVEGVTLSEAQMPSHRHINTASLSGSATASLSYTPKIYSNQANYSRLLPSSSHLGLQLKEIDVSAFSVSVDTSGMGVSMSNALTGSGNSHSNLQPYAILNHIIKHD